MKTSVEKLEGNRVKLTVTVPAEQVDAQIAKAYASAAKEARIPGFRKGHAPRAVLDTHVGRPAVLARAQEELIEESYPAAIDAEELRPIDNPEIEELPELVEGADYTFEAEVEIRPELALTGWEGLTVTAPPEKASDAEVDAQIDQMRERHSTLEVVEDRGIAPGDFALVSFTSLVDGEHYEGDTVDKYLYELGRDLMPKEFEDALMGAKAGDTVHAEFDIPETTSNPGFVGKRATFEIGVHEVKTKVLPEVDDAFAGDVGGFDGVEELRADVRGKLDENKAFGRAREVERGVRVALAERLVGDAPEPMVMSRRDSMIRDFFANLESRGISLKDYVNASGVDPEQIQADIEREARARVAQELALEALYRGLGLETTDEDVDAEIAEIAEGSDKTPEALRAEWVDAGVMQVLREQVAQRKATEWLIANVNVIEGTAETAETAGTPEKEE